MQRDKKSGPRYPNGRHKALGNKPSIEPFAPALIQRIKRAAKQRWEDPRLGSQVGELLMRGELTAAQGSAAFHVAGIYGAFEHYAGITRSARSPSYENSRGEALLSEIEQGRRDDRERSARKQFEKLQKEIPFGVRAAVELLIVEDRSVPSQWLPQLRDLLTKLATKWRQEKAENGSSIPLHFNQHEGDELSQARRDREKFRASKSLRQTA